MKPPWGSWGGLMAISDKTSKTRIFDITSQGTDIEIWDIMIHRCEVMKPPETGNKTSKWKTRICVLISLVTSADDHHTTSRPQEHWWVVASVLMTIRPPQETQGLHGFTHGRIIVEWIVTINFWYQTTYIRISWCLCWEMMSEIRVFDVLSPALMTIRLPQETQSAS